MDQPGSPKTLFGRVAIAHLLGLWTAGVIGTIPSSTGFSLSEGLFIGLVVGGLLSLPWMIALGLFIWFCGGLIERHPVRFALLGPLLVCGTWAVTFGAMLEAVAVSAAVSSAVYLLLWLLVGRKDVEAEGGP